MKITYIHHSCFCVELDDIVLIFDYFKGELPVFESNKHIYVFASHKHGDHFSRLIFDMAEKYPNITYILSKDIHMTENYMNRLNIPEHARECITYIGKNSEVLLSTLHIETLASTDQGVAFLITYHDRVIYHAGDLNWWTWQGETEDEYTSMKTRFIKEMNKLKGRKIHVAFVPLDPRQEDRFWWGFDTFMKTANVEIAFPMHFWEDYSIIKKLKLLEESKSYMDKVMDVQKEGEVFNL